MQNTETGRRTPPSEAQDGASRSGWSAALHRLEDALLIGLFVAMLAMAVVQIFMREVFSSGVVWGDVLVRILVLWICLFGAMVAARDDKHIHIDIVTRYLPEKGRLMAGAAVRILTTGVCVFMAWQGMKLVQLDFEYNTPAFASVPAWMCETVIPFGFGVMGLRYLLLSVRQVRRAMRHPL